MPLKQDISIGQNLRHLRQKAGYTQEQLAAKLQTMDIDISREIISQMELGRYSVRVRVLLALRHLYQVPMDDFFTDLDYE